MLTSAKGPIQHLIPMSILWHLRNSLPKIQETLNGGKTQTAKIVEKNCISLKE